MGLGESLERAYKSRKNDGIKTLSKGGGDQEEDWDGMIRDIFCIQTKNMNAHLRVAVRLVLKFLKSYSFLVMSHLRVVCRCISVISWLSIHFSLVFGLVDATTSAFQIFCHYCLLENGPG